MRKISIAVAAVTLILALGCNKSTTSSYNNEPGKSPTLAQTTNLSPEELGKLGAEIKKHPKDAEKLLSEKGLSQEQFEKAVRKVAESPEDSKRYAAAYKKAS